MARYARSTRASTRLCPICWRGIWESKITTRSPEPPMTPAIEFQSVSKIYHRMFSEERVAALADVSFEAAAGEVCAFLGPNGAGKTTSINILMGFLFADSGKVSVLGCEPGSIQAKQQIGFVPENFAFHKFLTAPQLLRMHLALAGKAGGEALIPELLARV